MTTETATTTSTVQKTTPRPSLVTEEASQKTLQEPDDVDPNTEQVPAKDTLSSSSDSLQPILTIFDVTKKLTHLLQGATLYHSSTTL